MDNTTGCEFKSFCRICLKVRPHMRFLSSSEMIDGKICSLSQMVKSCTSIQIYLEEEFPNMICQDCINRLYISWDFKMDCKNSEAKLHQNSNLSTPTEIVTTSKKNVSHDDISNFKNNLLIRRNMGVNTRQVIVLNNNNNNISLNHNNLINESSRKHCNDTENVVTSILHSKESTGNLSAYNANKENRGNNVEYFEDIENESTIESDSLCEYDNTTKDKKNNILTQLEEFAVIDLTLSDTENIENNTENENSGNSPSTEQDASKGKVLANNFKKNKCSYCSKIFVTELGLQKHMKKHKLQCPICNEKLPLLSNLETHLKTHVEEHSLKCPKCPKYFSSILMFNKHKSVHDNTKPYDCELCCKKFISCQDLKLHFTHAHSGINKYFCDVCMKGFALKIMLNEHKKIHTKDDSHKCNDLTEHTSVSSFNCEICDGKFSTDASLNKHRMQHTTKPIVCKLDKQKNYNKKSKYVCKTCAKNFDTYEKLKTHIAAHFTCNECSESFKTLRLFNIHKKIHFAKLLQA